MKSRWQLLLVNTVALALDAPDCATLPSTALVALITGADRGIGVALT